MASWSLTLGLFVPKISPNRAKSYYSFHWKLKGDRALILTYLDNPMIWVVSILAIFKKQIGVKFGPKLITFSILKIFVKIWAFPLNGICITMSTTCGKNFSSIWHCLLELLPPPPHLPTHTFILSKQINK